MKKQIMSDLQILAETVTSSAALVVAFLNQENGSSASKSRPFHRTGPVDIPTSAPDDVKKARKSLIDATMAIQHLVMAPTEYHQQMSIQAWIPPW